MTNETRTVLNFFLSLRAIMLIGTVGALIGSLLMFYQGGLYLYEAWHTLMAPDTHAVAERAATAFRPSISSTPRAAAFSGSSSRTTISRTALAVAQAKAWPL